MIFLFRAYLYQGLMDIFLLTGVPVLSPQMNGLFVLLLLPMMSKEGAWGGGISSSTSVPPEREAGFAVTEGSASAQVSEVCRTYCPCFRLACQRQMGKFTLFFWSVAHKISPPPQGGWGVGIVVCRSFCPWLQPEARAEMG